MVSGAIHETASEVADPAIGVALTPRILGGTTMVNEVDDVLLPSSIAKIVMV